MYNNKGYGFVTYDNDENYGISLSSPYYVIKLLQEVSDFKLLVYLEKGWDNHHGVIGCIKDVF